MDEHESDRRPGFGKPPSPLKPEQGHHFLPRGTAFLCLRSLLDSEKPAVPGLWALCPLPRCHVALRMIKNLRESLCAPVGKAETLSTHFSMPDNLVFSTEQDFLGSGWTPVPFRAGPDTSSIQHPANRICTLCSWWSCAKGLAWWSCDVTASLGPLQQPGF